MGFLIPFFFIRLRPGIPWLFGAMTFAGAIKLKARDLAIAVKNPLPIIVFFISAHLIMPVAVLFLSNLIFGRNPDTVSGFVLVYTVPTAVSGFIWVSIYRGDPALSLALILLDTLLAPFLVPGTIRLLLGTSVMLDIIGMAISLVYMIVIPTIAGVALNEISRGSVPRIIGPYLGPVSKICLALVISANCAAVAGQIDFLDIRIWIIAAACIGFAVLGFSCGKLTGLVCRRILPPGSDSREKEVSIFFASGLRNTSAAMTLGIDFFPGSAALPSVLGIVFQQTICAITGKLYLGKRK